MFHFSTFSQKYRGDSGTIRLMDDLGQFTGRDDVIMLGGGKGQTLLDSENGRPARLPGGSNEAPTSQYRDVWEMGKPGASFELNNTANRLTKEDVCMRKGTQKLQALKSPLQIMAC